MNQIHQINNFNINQVIDLPITFYFAYNQYTNNNNKHNIRKYIMTYVNYAIYYTQRNILAYPDNYEEYINDQYDIVNNIMFSDIDNNIIIRFKHIIDLVNTGQKINIYNIFNIHDF